MLKNIKEFVKKWKEAIAARRSELSKAPSLAIFQVGHNEASNRYVKNKIKDCEEVGIVRHLYSFEEDVTEEFLINMIKTTQEFHDGVIVQLPLPSHISVMRVQNRLAAEKDVDGFRHDSPHKPCTPFGIVEYLKYCGFEFKGKNAVVIGRSDIVGKPMAQMLLDLDATVTVCHSKSDRQSMQRYCQFADLIVCAVGRAKFLNCESLPHRVIVDVGINFDENGKMVGDCYNTEDREVTPVPGGVGLLTRCGLLQNTLRRAERRENENRS